MKKTLLKGLSGVALAALLPLGGLADESYVYWMVDQSGSSSPYPFYAASMIGSDGQVYETVFANGSGTGTDEELTRLGDSVALSDMSFVIELYNDESWTPTYYSVWMSYVDMVRDRYVTTDPSGPSNTMKVGYFSTLPEPTSGVLMLLGLAALGLKRRKLNT